VCHPRCVPLRQPEDGQYRPEHAVGHYIVIKYTSCDTVVFDYIQFSKFQIFVLSLSSGSEPGKDLPKGFLTMLCYLTMLRVNSSEQV